MPVALVIMLASAATAMLQESFVQALPAPWSGIELPLLLLVALVTRLRVTDALAAALAAGLTAEALTSLPTGGRTALALAVAGTSALLATRVFSHRSLTGTVAITVAAYVLHRAGETALRSLHAMIEGVPADAAGAPPHVAGLAVQLILALAITFVARTWTSMFSRTFLIR